MIPYGRQSIDEEDIQAVVETLQSDFLTQGPAVKRFESSLAARCDAKFAVACNSGTAALHMAYAAAGIGPGSTVVVPANTFLATANAAVYLGAEVRFCDVDPRTGLMTPVTLRQVLDDSVDVVAPVHFTGQACDMAAIEALCQQICPKAILVEDASHAIGGCYGDGSPVGNGQHASMTTFSFHPVKHIAAGEGGAVLTNDSELLERLNRFRCHGMTKSADLLTRPDEGPWYYEMHELGFNYRIPEAACALAASQMKKLDTFIQRRREIAKAYFDELVDIDCLSLPERSDLESSAWHLYCTHIAFDRLGQSRADVMASLMQQGIGTQVHYYPVSLQPFYQKRYGCSDADFPGAVQHYREALSFPMFPAMTDQNVSQVISAVRSVMKTQLNAVRRAA